MKLSIAAAVFTTIFATPVFAVLHPGDILVDQYQGTYIQQYSPSGALLQTFSDGNATSGWAGDSVTTGGQVVTSFRFPNAGVNIFNANGTLARTFLTPQLTTSGDVAIFSDGNIAITDQLVNKVFIYTPTGTFVNSFSVGAGINPVGMTVSPSNTLWVANELSDSLSHMTESGTVQGSFGTSSRFPVDLVLDQNGNIWTTGAVDGMVSEYSPTGALLSSFPTGLSDTLIAMGNDGSIYLDTQFTTNNIFHYSTSGTLLGSFAMTGANNPFTLTVVPVPEPGTLCLMGAAIAGMLGRRRKRKSSRC